MGEKNNNVCSLWERNWVVTQPPGNIRKAFLKGAIRPECLPEDLKREFGLIKAKEEIEKEKEIEKEEELVREE